MWLIAATGGYGHWAAHNNILSISIRVAFSSFQSHRLAVNLTTKSVQLNHTRVLLYLYHSLLVHVGIQQFPWPDLGTSIYHLSYRVLLTQIRYSWEDCRFQTDRLFCVWFVGVYFTDGKKKKLNLIFNSIPLNHPICPVAGLLSRCQAMPCQPLVLLYRSKKLQAGHFSCTLVTRCRDLAAA